MGTTLIVNLSSASLCEYSSVVFCPSEQWGDEFLPLRESLRIATLCGITYPVEVRLPAGWPGNDFLWAENQWIIAWEAGGSWAAQRQQCCGSSFSSCEPVSAFPFSAARLCQVPARACVGTVCACACVSLWRARQSNVTNFKKIDIYCLILMN